MEGSAREKADRTFQRAGERSLGMRKLMQLWELCQACDLSFLELFASGKTDYPERQAVSVNISLWAKQG